jgi:glycosyltransferase involved in cell wall biosynthesis
MILNCDNPKSRLKLCLIGSKKPYPAFDSTSSILKEILGPKNVLECRTGYWTTEIPSILRFFFCMVQDIAIYLRIVYCYKRNQTNVILIFQGYYPFMCTALKLLNVRLLLYIGGSGFRWSGLENTSVFGRVLVYANLLIENICHAQVDMIVTLSKSMIKTIRTEKNSDKTYFALPRLDRCFFEKFEIIDNYTTRKNIVGFVGNIGKRKGILNLLEAIQFLKSKNNYRFLIGGEGPLLGEIRARVKRLGVESIVEVTGFVDNKHIAEYYNKMKLYVLPSYAEGIPSTIFEAMACGTPVLATPVGGVSDIVKNNETGFLLSSNDPKELAARIAELLDNPELLERVSSTAYEYVTKEFCYERTVESWRKILRTVTLDIHEKFPFS